MTSEQWFQADLTDDEFEDNKHIAIKMFKEGYEYTFSNGICESMTAGYGRCDGYGYFEYPLPVDQETWTVDIDE